MTKVIGPRQPHIVEEELDDDIVLYDPVRNQVYELNPTASDVWRLANGDFTIEEIVDRLSSSYGTPADEIRPAVVELVEGWTKAHLFAEEA